MQPQKHKKRLTGHKRRTVRGPMRRNCRVLIARPVEVAGLKEQRRKSGMRYRTSARWRRRVGAGVIPALPGPGCANTPTWCPTSPGPADANGTRTDATGAELCSVSGSGSAPAAVRGSVTTTSGRGNHERNNQKSARRGRVDYHCALLQLLRV